jgi:hypothetical protein
MPIERLGIAIRLVQLETRVTHARRLLVGPFPGDSGIDRLIGLLESHRNDNSNQNALEQKRREERYHRKFPGPIDKPRNDGSRKITNKSENSYQQKIRR